MGAAFQPAKAKVIYQPLGVVGIRPLELPAVSRGWPPAMIYPPYGKTLQKMVYKLFIR